MSIIEKLTEGVVRRDVQKEGAAILEKWEKTGLLEGIGNDHTRSNMAALLENQAKELLREASSMVAGDVEGFAAVAFPIVRRVFGGLIANELVSVQPMSLPSGLIFFLDFVFNSSKNSAGAVADESLYGGGVVGSEITGGVSLTGDNAEKSFYSLNNGYASPTGSASVATTILISGTVGTGNAALDAAVNYDPDLSGSVVSVATIPLTSLTNANFNGDDFITVKINNAGDRQIRRLTRLSGTVADNKVLVVLEATGTNNRSQTSVILDAANSATFAIKDNFTSTGAALGGVVGASQWALENSTTIPEIDIKVDAVSVTAVTKKLKAKWTPELQQDINAYHNLDAEVELTSLLSEQIALEIDQEILEDLVKGATAGTFYWSRKPGKFVNRTGANGTTTNETLFPDFTGTVSEWYETLLETINDVSAQIHRKTLRGGANFIVVSPEVANILEFTAGFRADTTADENRGTAGAVKVGQLSKKLDIYVDPYFLRNVILVGRKGNSFLESGYVYAPYVPLQVTPTIFDPESFTPRKGVMTRYAKKMVRPDMYGLVICQDLLG